METLERPQTLFEEQFDKLIEQFEPHGLTPNDLTDLNNWQKIAALTNDIATPANVISTGAFAASIYGANNLDSWKGTAAACGSFMANYFGGKAADATGTASEVAEVVEATGSKIKLAFALYNIWQMDLAPKNLVTSVAMLNGMNTALAAVDRIVYKEPVLHPTGFGERAALLQRWGIGLHVIAGKVEKTHAARAQAMKVAGYILGFTGVGIGVWASADYASTRWEAKKSPKRWQRNKN